jgi:hypothetical protein
MIRAMHARRAIVSIAAIVALIGGAMRLYKLGGS